MFSIGDKVIVVWDGHRYGNYAEWAVVNGLEGFVYQSIPEGEECEVVCRGYHGTSPDRIVYGIRDKNGRANIYNGDGLALAPKKVKLWLEYCHDEVRVHSSPHGKMPGSKFSVVEVNTATGEVTQI